MRLIGFLFLALTAQSAQAATCDRPCLARALDGYLTAVTRHDPQAAKLASSYRATENAIETAAGAGIWQSATALGPVQRRYLDPVTGQAAYHGLLLEGDKQVIVSVRVKVDDGAISEAEWTIARAGNGLFNLAGYANDALPTEQPIPAAKRTSRFNMIALANGYFQGLQDHDGSLIPAEPKCPRIENGMQTTFRKMSEMTGAAPAPNAAPGPGQERISGNCISGFEVFRTMIAETTLRRFPLVDEEQGVVMGTTIFRRPPTSQRPRNLLTEYFYVRGGKLSAIWAVMFYMPPEQPSASGWSN